MFHTCVLTAAGGVKCWGDNRYGQLGDGITTNRVLPVDVSGLTGNVSAIAVGTDHSCALMISGAVRCWGRNDSGQLGDGGRTNRTAPVTVVVPAGTLFTAITAGQAHTCALSTSGGIMCWGSNAFGQLGDGTTTCQKTPVNVSDLTSGVRAVVAGDNFTYALTTTWGVKCWGDNTFRQLGDRTRDSHSTPVDMFYLTSGVSAISAGTNHTCALTDSGAVKCWGYNGYGQLDDGTTNVALTRWK